MLKLTRSIPSPFFLKPSIECVMVSIDGGSPVEMTLDYMTPANSMFVGKVMQHGGAQYRVTGIDEILTVERVYGAANVQETSDIEKVQRKVERALAKLLDSEKELLRAQSQLTVICQKNHVYSGTACGASIPIGELTYIREHHYVAPHGCSDGDYWSVVDSDAMFVCPHCKYVNRLYDRPEFLKLSKAFLKT